MVLAVPITPQVPAVGASSSLRAEISSMSIVPARNFAQLLRQSVQAPTLVPLCDPGIIGPVTS